MEEGYMCSFLSIKQSSLSWKSVGGEAFNPRENSEEQGTASGLGLGHWEESQAVSFEVFILLATLKGSGNTS